MSDPMFPRQFQFELPLFENKGGAQSPWLTVVGKPTDINQE